LIQRAGACPRSVSDEDSAFAGAPADHFLASFFWCRTEPGNSATRRSFVALNRLRRAPLPAAEVRSLALGRRLSAAFNTAPSGSRIAMLPRRPARMLR